MKKGLIIIFSFTLLVIGFSSQVEAVSTRQQLCTGSGGIWEARDGNPATCHTDTNKGPTVTQTIQNVINTLLFVVGVAAVIVIVIAGFRMVTANGDSQAVAKARSSVIYAVVGIVVAVSAYAIVNFILDQL